MSALGDGCPRTEQVESRSTRSLALRARLAPRARGADESFHLGGAARGTCPARRGEAGRKEIARASESIRGNIAEGRERAGLDRPDFYRRASGSASELTTWLRIARSRGYITHAEWAHVDEELDRVRAMLWRLTH